MCQVLLHSHLFAPPQRAHTTAHSLKKTTTQSVFIPPQAISMSTPTTPGAPEQSEEEKAFLKLKEYTAAEIAKHNTEESPWLIIHGRVYDITPYLDEHPGGPEIMVDNAGKNASEEYDDIGHSDDATEKMAEFMIGRLKGFQFADASGDGDGAGGGGGMSLILVLLIPVILAALYYQFVVLAETEV